MKLLNQKNFLFLAMLFFIPHLAQADEIYLRTMNMLDILMTIVFGLCHIAGIVFVFLSFIYYRRFRQNPNETPLGRVLWTLVLGVIIFLIPTIAQMNGIYGTMQEASVEAPLNQ